MCVIWVGVNRKKGYNIRKTHVFDSLNKVLLIAQNIRKAGELLVCFSDSIWSSIFYDVIRFQWYICSFVSFAFFSRCRCCSTKLCRNLYQFLSNNGTKCLHKRSYDWNGHWRWLMYFEFHLKKKTNECTVLRSDFICKYFQFEKWLFLSLLSVQNEFWARNEGKIWNILNA